MQVTLSVVVAKEMYQILLSSLTKAFSNLTFKKIVFLPSLLERTPVIWDAVVGGGEKWREGEREGESGSFHFLQYDKMVY